MPLQVVMLQDLQVPRETLEAEFRKRDLVPIWPPFDTPTDACALATDGRGRVTDEDLARHPRAKVLVVAFVGTNHVDKEACRQRGIAVLNCPDYSSTTVAELTIGLALSVLREIPASERTLRAGGWEHSPAGMEIRDKVVGIVGLGHIGLSTAKLFKAFSPREVIGWSRREKSEFCSAPLNGRQVSLEELFASADIICLSVLLTEETRGMVTRELMDMMKPTSILINIARAQLCDMDALVENLCARRFRAALDVFSEEPLPPNDPIRKIPQDQVVLVPHIGYKSYEALQRRLVLAADNLCHFAAGRLDNVVVPAAVKSMETLETRPKDVVVGGA
eukprot:TRINITY_DN75429_c0_g1_i1.p1 TRINITY_DN75429_c0_g1~~TRINITY_DN75429_c0_g1_i1.p1  ORF type:complete len:334 (+),score=54.37 TRINITY_DN75429_c0_g1_i1:155-1156(+)